MCRIQKNQRELQELIEAALDDKATVDEASTFMAKLEKHDSEEVRLATHDLIHFLDDSDIRKRDQNYNQSQRQELQKWLRILSRINKNK